MTINEYELAELLTDEIFLATTVREFQRDWVAVELQWGSYERAILQHCGAQTFFISQSNSGEMFPGNTIDVNEILDIVL